MKLNISYPATGCQKLIEIDDEKRLRPLYEKRMAAEVQADCLGDEWKGYVLRITGGNDKQGFPMKQGVLTTGRVKLLLDKGMSCYRPRRHGQRRRKSVRGCIVDGNLSVLALKIVKKGESEIPGLTDKTVPRRLGPKRASKIRKLFNLSKEDDVRQYVVRRPLPVKEGKRKRTTAPKIQRLVTPLVLQRKRHRFALKRKRSVKKREEAAEYAKLLALRIKQAKERKRSRSRSNSRSASTSKSESKSETKSEVKPAKIAKMVKAEATSIKSVKSVGKSSGKASAKSAGKPAAKSAAKSAGKPAAKSAAKSAKPAKTTQAAKTAKPAKTDAKSSKKSAKSAK